MRKIVVGFAVFLMMGLIFVQSANAQVVMTMQVNVSFDQDTKSVNVSPGSDCTVMFSGNITYSYSYRATISVSTRITGENTQGWVVGVSPTRYTAESGNYPIPLTIMVHVPPETSECATGTISVTVSAMPWGWTETNVVVSDSVVVSVLPYHKTSLSCSTPYTEIGPGRETYFNLQMTNLGNINDTFEIGIENENDFPGWVIQKERSSIYVPEKSTENVRIMIITSKDWTLWGDDVVEIKINATSLGSGGTVSESYPVYLRQRGSYIPGFDPMFMIIALGIIAIMLRRIRKC